MRQSTSSSLHLAEVRELAKRFDANAIEHCMTLALQKKENPCYAAAELEDIMNVLAKASFVQAQMQHGSTLAEAIRELGKRIRSIQSTQ